VHLYLFWSHTVRFLDGVLAEVDSLLGFGAVASCKLTDGLEVRAVSTIALMMEATRSSGRSDSFYETARLSISAGRHINTRRRENLKTHGLLAIPR
jgi:hypothetical protein